MGFLLMGGFVLFSIYLEVQVNGLLGCFCPKSYMEVFFFPTLSGALCAKDLGSKETSTNESAQCRDMGLWWREPEISEVLADSRGEHNESGTYCARKRGREKKKKRWTHVPKRQEPV